MKHRLLDRQEGRRTFALILAAGDEAIASLTSFASDQRLTASHFTAIGAFERSVVAYFDWQTKRYRHVAIDEQTEVLSLVGDVTLADGRPQVHAHVVLGKADATAHGGHLIQGHVRPTLEIVLTEEPAHLRRRFDAGSGLALIDPSAEDDGATGARERSEPATMLGPGGQVPHFDVATVDGGRVRYADVWQHRNLVLVLLGADTAATGSYAKELQARAREFAEAETVLAVTAETVRGLPSPAAIVADRWGEIIHVAPGGDGWPSPDDLLEWVNVVQRQCPECPPL